MPDARRGDLERAARQGGVNGAAVVHRAHFLGPSVAQSKRVEDSLQLAWDDREDDDVQSGCDHARIVARYQRRCVSFSSTRDSCVLSRYKCVVRDGKPSREEQQPAEWCNRPKLAAARQSHHVQAAGKQDDAAEEKPGREDAAGGIGRWPKSAQPDRERVYEAILPCGLPPSEALLAISLLLSPVFEPMRAKGTKCDAEKAEDSSEQKGEAFHAPSMA